jgi:hypothetical protein
MLRELHKKQNLSYTGTIIDIETIGEFCDQYKGDSREYKDLIIVIFGYINEKGLHIYCAQGNEDIPILEEKTKQLLETLDKERPLCAYQCHNEMGVFFHRLNLKFLFDKELQTDRERKENALRRLGIFDSFGDPFHNELKPGNACRIAWLNNYFDNAIKHNCACLLKEQTLLLKGHVVAPRPLDFEERIDAPSRGPSLAFQPWTQEQKDYAKQAWNEGKMLKTIAQDCGRTPNAVWMRLQRLNVIPSDIPYAIEMDSWTIKDLP